MMSEVVVANCKDLQNSECDKYNNFDKIPVLIKEEIDGDCGNIVFSEYGDVTFIESKVEIKEHILDASEAMPVLEESAIEEKANQKSQDLISSNPDIVFGEYGDITFTESKVEIKENILDVSEAMAVLEESAIEEEANQKSQDLISSNPDIVFGEYGDITFTESIVEIKENILDASEAIPVLQESAIEEKANQKVSEIHYNHRENVLIRESFKSQDLISSNPDIVFGEYGDITFTESKVEIKENILDASEAMAVLEESAIEENNQKSQDLISSNPETSHVKERILQSPSDVIVNEKSNKDGIEDKTHIDTLTNTEGICSQEKVEKINQDMCLNTNKERNISNTSSSELNNDNIDVDDNVPSNHKNKPHAKDKAKQSSHHESNVKVIEFDGRVQSVPVRYNIEKDFVLSVIVERKAICEEKIYQMMLDTEAKLFVSLKQEDLCKLQKQHNEDHRCAQCSFQTKYKHHLVRHFDMHKAIYHKCIHCDFRTKYPNYMNIHVRMIHNTDEVELLKCKKCSFQTKYKKSLKSHVLTHNKVRKMYKCALCPFETPCIETLRKSHMIRHKSEEEARIHKCESCSYKAKTKYDLKRHEHGHKSIDEVKMHKCGICSFQTRHKYYINTHRSTHQVADEDNMHPCDLCSYQGKTRRLLLKHKGKHKQSKMYKCEECPYQSRNSHNLKRHSVQHKTVEELTLFYCDKCSYRGITKDRLRGHYNNVHKHPGDIKWKKCNVCDFKTKKLGNLKRHMLIHK